MKTVKGGTQDDDWKILRSKKKDFKVITSGQTYEDMLEFKIRQDKDKIGFFAGYPDKDLLIRISPSQPP